jgi:hypothetical protein
MSVEQLEVILPSNPADKKEIVDAFEEIGNAWIRASAEREFVKDAIAALSEKFDIPKKVLSKLAKIHYKASIDAVEHENDAVTTAYRIITGTLKEDF